LGEGYPKSYQGPRTETQAADPGKVASLYSQLLGRTVPEAEVFDAQGKYLRLNKWNTELGIIHLTHPAKYPQRRDFPRGRRYDPTAPPRWLTRHRERELALWARFGEEDPPAIRTSAMSSTSSRVAGFYLTLRNPVGLYMDRLDTTGWTMPGPGGTSVPAPASFFRMVRGYEVQRGPHIRTPAKH
jgi:hypothetical protein